MPPNIWSFVNQKGGVAKTTSCLSIAAVLARKHKVLLIDLDPQGNATMGSGVNKNELTANINDVLLGRLSAKDAVLTTSCDYRLLAANSDLTEAEVGLLKNPDREKTLLHLVNPLRNQYDYILIDCPPSLNMLTVNALVASSYLVVPLQCEYYALEGLSSLLETVAQVQVNANKKLQILGVVRTMFDTRNKLSEEVSQQLMISLGKKLVCQTIIPRNVRLAEAPSHGLPITLYDPTSKGALSYQALTKELLKRTKKAQSTSKTTRILAVNS